MTSNISNATKENFHIDKKDVSYLLDINLRLDIIKIKNEVLRYLQNPKIYLFGSIAKGCYSKYSDIDLLILIDSEKSVKELRQLKHNLEDLIESLNISRAVDIKLYTISRYNELCTKPGFENSILENLIDIRRW